MKVWKIHFLILIIPVLPIGYSATFGSNGQINITTEPFPFSTHVLTEIVYGNTKDGLPIPPTADIYFGPKAFCSIGDSILFIYEDWNKKLYAFSSKGFKRWAINIEERLYDIAIWSDKLVGFRKTGLVFFNVNNGQKTSIEIVNYPSNFKILMNQVHFSGNFVLLGEFYDSGATLDTCGYIYDLSKHQLSPCISIRDGFVPLWNCSACERKSFRSLLFSGGVTCYLAQSNRFVIFSKSSASASPESSKAGIQFFVIDKSTGVTKELRGISSRINVLGVDSFDFSSDSTAIYGEVDYGEDNNGFLRDPKKVIYHILRLE